MVAIHGVKQERRQSSARRKRGRLSEPPMQMATEAKSEASNGRGHHMADGEQVVCIGRCLRALDSILARLEEAKKLGHRTSH